MVELSKAFDFSMQMSDSCDRDVNGLRDNNESHVRRTQRVVQIANMPTLIIGLP